jgi:predicted phosphodiesterase
MVTGLFGDTHFPYANKKVYKLIIEKFKSSNIDQLIIAGDFVDFAKISFWKSDPNKKSTAEEIKVARKKLKELRETFPNIPIKYMIGNHDTRWPRYIMDKTPELEGIEELKLDKILGLKQLKIKLIDPIERASMAKPPIRLGGLYVIHGSPELKLGWQGVHLSRNYWLKAYVSLLVFHHHQKQVYKVRRIDGKYESVNLVGCVCAKNEHYAPYPAWQWGCALVEHNNKKRIHKVFNYEITDNYEFEL